VELQIKCVIKKFKRQGEKTGWTYIEIPATVAQKLKPGNKKTFRTKGKIDDTPFNSIAILPMGEGNFIMALNAEIRKKIRKTIGAIVKLSIAVDESPIVINEELIQCLADEPDAQSFFNSLTPGHKKYFSNWINTAKTAETKTQRIAHCVNALSLKLNYAQMLRRLAGKKY